MKYLLNKVEDRLILDFKFNMMKTYLYTLVSVIIMIFIFFNLKTSIKSNILSIFVGIVSLSYLSLVDYVEWFRHKKHSLQLIDNDLYINDKFIIQKDRVNAIYVEYINSLIEGGWRVSINNFRGDNKYVFKERLSIEEGKEIAFFINTMINKKIILIKEFGTEVIYEPS